MAARKPLFLSSEGFSQEMALADTAQFGGLTLTGELAMGTNKITGLADGTVDSDAVNKGQLDQAIISGGSVKEMLMASEQLDNTDGIYAAMMAFFANQPISGDVITITDGTTTRTYGAASGGDLQFSIGATVADTMQNFATAVAGDGSASWTAVFTTEFDEINSAGVVMIIDDATTAAAQNPIRTYGTFGTQADLQVVEYSDGTTPDQDYRSNTSTTASTTDPGNGRVGLQRQAAALGDGDIHYTREADVTWSWDDSDNVWQQMSGSGSIPTATSASGGGVQGKWSADSDKGLVIVAGVGEVNIDAVTLDFDPTTKKIEVTGVPALFEVAGTPVGATVTAANLDTLTDTSNADALHSHSGTSVSLAHSDLSGVGTDDHHPQLHTIASHSDTTATGAELDTLTDGSNADSLHLHTGTSVSLAHSDLSGVGTDDHHPQLHTIASHSDTSATGAELDTLTDGSNADSLHVHAGGSSGDHNVDSAVAVADPVYWTSTGDRIAKADAATLATTRPFGVATSAQAVVGSPASVVSLGVAASVFVGATPGTRYYLASGGGLTATRPTGSGNRVIQMGFAKNATDLWVEISDYGRVA
jgi:hypothetical protein